MKFFTKPNNRERPGGSQEQTLEQFFESLGKGGTPSIN